jgi:hypothetical protein
MIKKKLLVNLTNHPSAMWSHQQIIAAQQYGSIKDIPFPKIDEKANEAYISAMAEEYASSISKLTEDYDVTVHLMGELTFTFALLKRLQGLGIPCIASTSKRIVGDETCGRKSEVVFQFERFRRFE